MRAFGLAKVAAFYGAMFAVAAAVLRGSLPGVCLPPSPLAFLQAIALGLAVGLALVATTRLAAARSAWGARLAEELRVAIGELSLREAWMVALLSGIGEEALFRGALQPMLGLWLGSLLFALLHIGPSRGHFAWTVMAFGAGLAFGGLLLATGTLVAPMLAHITVNFLNLRHLAVADRSNEVNVGSA
jgi:uncharacterized protein